MSDPITRLNAALEGRYHIERQVGEGGMATVYLARDEKHNRNVALKVLKPELAAVVGAERFLAEIETTANLQHPHILPLFDSGEADSFLFYVMPYVEGESLRERLDRERQLPVGEAIRIASNMGEALGYAHRHGVIHRDIKPSNLLLVDGKPVLSDFGIALAVGAAGGGRLTETGLSLGTPHYMSPEQATGDLNVGPASDIYALACVLYEMLVGEPPFTGSTAQAVLGKIVTGDPELVTTHRKSVPKNVEAAILKALDKVPADRFQRAEEFVAAMGDADFRLSRNSIHAGDRSSRAWRIATLATSGTSVGLAAALAFAVLGRTGPELPLIQLSLLPPDGSSFGTQVALSPNGEWVAYVTEDGALFRRRLGQLRAEPVPGGEDAAVPFFSYDNRSLGFHSGGRIFRSPLGGGPSVRVAEAVDVHSASWGEDDIIVFSANRGNLFRVPASGGDPVQVPNTAGRQYIDPWVLPGGDAALVTTRGPVPDRRILLLDLGTGATDTIARGTRAAFGSGHILFSQDDGPLFAQPFDPAKRQVLGPPVAILDGVARTGYAGVFSTSTDGGLVYQAGGVASDRLMLEGPDGPSTIRLPEDGNLEGAVFSPDGRRIALRYINLGETQDIHVFDRETGTLNRVTTEGLLNMNPVWTPDGSRIAFMRHLEGVPTGQIYWQPVDEAVPAERLMTGDLSELPSSWTPDGRTLAFHAFRDNQSDVGLYTLGDTVPRWVVATEFNESQPQVSPDGRWLAYTSDLSGQFEVYVQAIDGTGGRMRVSVSGGHSPRWDPATGARTLYYLASGGGGPAPLTRVRVRADGAVDADSREELFEVTDSNPEFYANYDVRPNGEEILHIDAGDAGGHELVWILNWPKIVEQMTSGG